MIRRLSSGGASLCRAIARNDFLQIATTDFARFAARKVRRIAMGALPQRAVVARNLQLLPMPTTTTKGKRTMDMNPVRNVLVGVAALIIVSGCAGDSASRRADERGYENDIDRAAASIDEAEKAGAFEQAGADLSRARAKLDAARKASQDGDEDVAQRLAVEADLDAQLASATARNQEMQAAVTEVQESIRALQDELHRNEQRSLGRL
jgi:hypothetical protein